MVRKVGNMREGKYGQKSGQYERGKVSSGKWAV